MCLCACTLMPRVGPGLSASVDKEQMATLTGQKTSSSHILVFYSALTSILPMATWHVWQGRLRFILECSVMSRQNREQKCLLSCVYYFFSWGHQTSCGNQAVMASSYLNDPIAMITCMRSLMYHRLWSRLSAGGHKCPPFSCIILLLSGISSA